MIRYFLILIIFAGLLPAGCGYKFVDPFPGSDYALVSVRNATPEPGLAAALEEELRMSGGFRKSSSNNLSITVTRFNESVDSIGSSGLPVRQELSMEISWKVEDSRSAQATFGSKTVKRTYPYSAVPSTLEWNRRAAVRLLTEMGAREILNELRVIP